MLSKKVADLLNNQVNKELYSAYLYLDFENYYHDKSLEVSQIGIMYKYKKRLHMLN